jgi:hypothetical protein
MSDLFQLPIGTAGTATGGPFSKYGLETNPFPPTGLESGVLYTDHLTSELTLIQGWIDEVGQATQTAGSPPAAIRPLAIFGSLGVGKTHLLNFLEQGLRRNQSTPTLRKGLADEGMTRLVLADLFLRYLPFSDEQSDPGTGYLRRLIDAGRQSAGVRDRMRASLREGSPVRVPFFAALDADEEDSVTWLSRWLRREYTTPAQRSKLGLSGVLQSEGEAVRAVADLMRLGHAAGVLRAWFILIDQLEELWRPNVITPTRRARFLTDLRHLVDEAFEGAPIALLLAWNTTVEEDLFSGPPDVRDRMEHDYRALWQRLGDPVDLPALRQADVWPFALKYLHAANIRGDSQEPQKKKLFDLLEAASDDVVRERTANGLGGLAPRKVLSAWRTKAAEIATKA